MVRALPNDSLLVVAVETPAGAPIFRTAGEAGPVADTASMIPWLAGARVRVALRAEGLGRLPIAPAPPSRAPALVGLLVLTAGLTLVTVRHLRREHELARMRSEFTASVSHELRTPLAQILLYGETLVFDRARSGRARRTAAEVIVREARRLMRMVENALHFARAERRLVELAPERVRLAGAASRSSSARWSTSSSSPSSAAAARWSHAPS